MDDYTNLAERTSASLQSPVLVIIQHLVLTLAPASSTSSKGNSSASEILELATTADLDSLSGRDVRLVALDIGDRTIADPTPSRTILALLAVFCPNAFVALLSNRDDEATASAAMQRGVRGFFPTSIPVEVAIAGLRLVLAGGVYRPLPIMGQNDAHAVPQDAYSGAHRAHPQSTITGNGATAILPRKR